MICCWWGGAIGGERVKKERENRVAMKMVREKMAATVRVITESILIGGIKTQSSVGIMLIDTVWMKTKRLYILPL